LTSFRGVLYIGEPHVSLESLQYASFYGKAAAESRSYWNLDTHDSVCTKATLIRVIPFANIQPCAECMNCHRINLRIPILCFFSSSSCRTSQSLQLQPPHHLSSSSSSSLRPRHRSSPFQLSGPFLPPSSPF